ncbi:MAG: MarC family protein [Rhodospirillales bacterium]|nr:MarC family protein [Rhodospirillales bacterium]
MGVTPHLKFLVALFVILNPIGIAPLFASMTEAMTPAERNRTALTTAAAVFVTCTLCALVGKTLLGFFGITVADLQIAGGLVVLLIGLGMVNAQPDRTKHTPAENEEGKGKDDPSVVPLAIPLTSGPGAMATAILATDDHSSFGEYAVVVATILVCSVLVLVIYRSCGRLQRLFGVTGMGILTRVMGLVVAAIAVQMIVTGLLHKLPLLPIAH